MSPKFEMFRLPHTLLIPLTLRPAVRHSRSVKKLPKFKISTSVENFIEISFPYGNLADSGKTISFKVKKDYNLQQIIDIIKLKLSLHKKKQEIIRTANRLYFGSRDVAEEVTDESDVDIALVKEDIVLDNSVVNFEAWTEGSLLKIGDTIYEINHNAPNIKKLTLPDFLIAGCMVRPHVQFECAVLEDCEFQWFREQPCENKENWLQVGEKYTYQLSLEDVGCKLKLICTAKSGEKIGCTTSVTSKNAVEKGPESFPFEDRHQFTKNLADNDCIRCVSYNVLANSYVDQKKFPYCSEKARDRYYRKQLLLKEIVGYNSDILCLQEVQEGVFEYDFLPMFKKINFDGFYHGKISSRQEGLAVFYRTTKFKLLEEKCVYLSKVVKHKEIINDLLLKVVCNYKDMSKLLTQGTVLQLVLLQHLNEPTKKVLVANTHLYSNKNMPEVRLLQAALCTSYAERVMKSEENADSTALIFCGDFNSLPDSNTYELITEGSFDCSSLWRNDSANQSGDMILRHDLTLASACGTPKYTNFTDEFHGCLDYIFYSKDYFNVSEIVPMPTHDQVIKHVALPSELFPSDHIPLICTLKWNDQTSPVVKQLC